MLLNKNTLTVLQKNIYNLKGTGIKWISEFFCFLILKVLVSLKILDENYRAKKHFKA